MHNKMKNTPAKRAKQRNKQREVQSHVFALHHCIFVSFSEFLQHSLRFFFTFLPFHRVFCCSLFPLTALCFLFVGRFLQTLSACCLASLIESILHSSWMCCPGISCIAFPLLVLCLLLSVWLGAVLFALPFKRSQW